MLRNKSIGYSTQIISLKLIASRVTNGDRCGPWTRTHRQPGGFGPGSQAEWKEVNFDPQNASCEVM